MRPRIAKTRRNERRYHHGALRAALVESAAQLAAERGHTAVTLREVARRAGVSQAAPYHYFHGKSALMAAVAEEGFRLLELAQATALADSREDANERLAALAASYVRFALDRPHYFRVMFRPSIARHGTPGSLDASAARTFDRLVETVRAARRVAGHDDLDPVGAATLIWAVPHGLALLYLDGPGAARVSPRELEDLARAAMSPLAAAVLNELSHADGHWGI